MAGLPPRLLPYAGAPRGATAPQAGIIQFFIASLPIRIHGEQAMADNDVSVESVEIPLLSEIKMSSATSIKGTYLPHPVVKADDTRGMSPVNPKNMHPEGPAGPDAMVYGTKLSSRTSMDATEPCLRGDPNREATLRTHDFYTVILSLSMWLGDPSTTRLINGTIDLVFPPEVTILDYSPKDKGTVTKMIENRGEGIRISPGLVFLTLPDRITRITRDTPDSRFRIPVGPKETRSGTYNRKTGYTLDLPSGSLLEYQGMIKNRHEMYWEVYPPMPPADSTMTGTSMLAVFSLIIRTPENYFPEIRAHINCRVKGNLWGVVPIRGLAVFR